MTGRNPERSKVHRAYRRTNKSSAIPMPFLQDHHYPLPTPLGAGQDQITCDLLSGRALAGNVTDSVRQAFDVPNSTGIFVNSISYNMHKTKMRNLIMSSNSSTPPVCRSRRLEGILYELFRHFLGCSVQGLYLCRGEGPTGSPKILTRL